MYTSNEELTHTAYIDYTYTDFSKLVTVAWPIKPLASFTAAMQHVQLIITSTNSVTIIVDNRFPTPVMVEAKISTVLDTITHGFENHINTNRILKHLWGLSTNQMVPITMPNSILFATGSFNRKLVSWFNLQAITAINKNSPKTIKLTLTFNLAKNLYLVTSVIVGRNSLSFDERLIEAIALQHNALMNYNAYVSLNGSPEIPPLEYSPALTTYIAERNLRQLQPLVTQDIINAKQIELVTTYYHQKINGFLTENKLDDVHIDISLYVNDLLHDHPKTWRHNVSLHTHQFHEKMSKYIELLNKINF